MILTINKFLFILIFITTLFPLGCNHLFYYPSSENYITPSKFNLKFENILIHTDDEETLHGWIIHSKNKSPIATIIHFHGNAENISSHFLYTAWLANKGFNIIEFDYRGYGTSTGKPTREGLLLDSQAVLNWAQKNVKTKDIFIIAQSLGGAVVIPAFAKTPINNVKAIILDSTFDSYREIAQLKLSNIWLTWPFQWPLSFLITDNLSPIDYIQNINIPLIFIHGKNDPVVPFISGYSLFTYAKEPKEFWEVPSSEHCAAFINKDDFFRKKLISFLCQNISTINDECKNHEKFIQQNSKNYIDYWPNAK